MEKGGRSDRRARKEEILTATLRGLLWMSGAVLSFSAMAVAARELLQHTGTFEVLFFRTSVALLIVMALAWRAGFATLWTKRFGLHFWRNLVHLGGQSSWVFAIGALPLATVFAIEFTSPIWTAVLAVLFLGERINTGTACW
jgi:drug/metabolite transporter (DMT)-like permease